jgi:beta-glucosidase/6-phospho-beta-glucosidase/beta-galactosidase
MPPLFGSWFLGGFECSAHKRADGIRLDLLASTGHAARAEADYRLLAAHGMRAARDGLRWHRIEARPGRYDWSSFLPQLHAARDTGTTVLWDLLHYGTPNGVDVFSPRFVERFAAFARAAAEVVRAETDAPPLWTPVNEISFWAWAGGDTGGLNPFARGRGGELKRQLVRATLAAAAEVRAVDHRARIATAEPIIHIFPASGDPTALARAAAHNEGQHEALDLLLGRIEPELGGHAGAIDILGINFYYNNQWIDTVRPVYLGDGLYRRFSDLLAEFAARYSQPLYIAETGTEGVFRPYWLRYIADEVRAAIARGVPVGGICLYPILSHLGWDDDRHCPNGLFTGFGTDCERDTDEAMATELAEQVQRFEALSP